jgi:hypothetical protein
MKYVPEVPGFLKGWFDNQDTTKDVKLLAFVVVVVFSVKKLWTTAIDPNWVNAYYGLCALVGLGGTAWTAVDKWSGKKEEPPEPK